MDLQDIAEVIRERRREAGLTQAELAERAGVSRARISQLESGALADMGFLSVLRLLNAVGLEMSLRDWNAGRPGFEEVMAEADRGPEPW